MDEHQRRRVADLLASSPVLGAEIDIRYRVLAITIEPAVADHPVGDVADRRLQVVLHPVGTIAAALVDHADRDRPTVLQFDEGQLADVVGAVAGATSTVTPLPDTLPDFDEMGERLSLFGTAQTGDGTAGNLHLRLADEPLTLDLWASFDEAELRDPDGEAL